MRYRPFANSGVAVSTISLALDGRENSRKPGQWRDLLHAAFEVGVNSFEILNPSPALLAGVADGVQAVKRSLLFVALRLPIDKEGEPLVSWAEETIEKSALGDVDMITADAEAAKNEAVLGGMLILQDRDYAHHLGVEGASEALLPAVESGLYMGITSPFSLLSGWRERNLVRMAMERGVGVIGRDSAPVALDELIDMAVDDSKVGGGWFKRKAPTHRLAGAGTYTFLRSTNGWTGPQICLAYALTEPAIASVQLNTTDAHELASLAEATDRDLPSAVTAQIEMARFSAGDREPKERRSA